MLYHSTFCSKKSKKVFLVYSSCCHGTGQLALASAEDPGSFSLYKTIVSEKKFVFLGLWLGVTAFYASAYKHARLP